MKYTVYNKLDVYLKSIKKKLYYLDINNLNLNSLDIEDL